MSPSRGSERPFRIIGKLGNIEPVYGVENIFNILHFLSGLASPHVWDCVTKLLPFSFKLSLRLENKYKLNYLQTSPLVLKLQIKLFSFNKRKLFENKNREIVKIWRLSLLKLYVSLISQNISNVISVGFSYGVQWPPQLKIYYYFILFIRHLTKFSEKDNNKRPIFIDNVLLNVTRSYNHTHYWHGGLLALVLTKKTAFDY